MRAIVMTSAGEPDVLQLQEISKPAIENEREVLVKLKAAGVNPVDTKLRKKGTFYPDKTPQVLGCDGAGVVEEVGAGVSKFQVGDEVYFCLGGMGGPKGNYAEYAVVDERFIAKKPQSLSFGEAAAAPLVLITAWESLYDRARLQAGQKVLIQAGAGGVGHVAIQLAKLQGAEVLTTVGTSEKADFVRGLGADVTVLYKEVDFVKATLDWTNGEGVDVGFDTVGGEVFYKTVPAVKIYGDLVTILDIESQYGNLKEARMRNLRLTQEIMLTPMLKNMVDALQDQAKILQQCARLIDEGKLKINVSKMFALEEAAEAHKLLEKGSMTGKIVLMID